MVDVATGGAVVAEAYAYCRDLTRQQAGNFYYAFFPLPKDQRLAVYAAYAFSRACDDYADEEIELGRKRELLEEHRRRLHDAYEGKPDGPTFVALADAAQRYSIPRRYFDELIDGVIMDLTITRYQTFEDLRKYCYRVASVVGLICIEIFGYEDPKAKAYAEDLGIAMQLVNIMRDVQEDADRDRIYLPLDDLERFGYSEAELLAGVLNDTFVALMRYQGDRAHRYFDEGGKLLPLLPATSRVCPAILRELYSGVLKRIEQRGYNVYQGRVSLASREKLWIAGRIWMTTRVKGFMPGARSLS